MTQTWHDDRGHIIPPPPPYAPPVAPQYTARSISPYATPAPAGKSITITPVTLIVGVGAVLMLVLGILIGTHSGHATKPADTTPPAVTTTLAPAAAAVTDDTAQCGAPSCYNAGYSVGLDGTNKVLADVPDVTPTATEISGGCTAALKTLTKYGPTQDQRTNYYTGCLSGAEDALTANDTGA